MRGGEIMVIKDLIARLRIKTDESSYGQALSKINKLRNELRGIKDTDVNVNIKTNVRNIRQTISNAIGDQQIKAQNNQLQVGAEILRGSLMTIGYEAVNMIKDLGHEALQASNTNASIRMQISQLTSDIKSQDALYKNLQRISNETHSDMQNTAHLYTQLGFLAPEMGINKQQTDIMTTTLLKSLAMSGATTSQKEGAIIQLKQMMTSSTLQWEDLRQINENSHETANMIAKGLGFASYAKLAEQVKGGKSSITGKQIAQAVLKQQEEVEKKYNQAYKLSMADAMVKAKNNFLDFVDRIENRSHVFSRMAKYIEELSDTFFKEGGTLDKLIPQVEGVVDSFGGLGNMLKTFGVAYATFKIVPIFMEMTKGATTLREAFVLLGTRLGWIGLVIAGVIIAFLALQDVMAFLMDTGQDTITGRIVNEIKEIIAFMKELANIDIKKFMFGKDADVNNPNMANNSSVLDYLASWRDELVNKISGNEYTPYSTSNSTRNNNVNINVNQQFNGESSSFADDMLNSANDMSNSLAEGALMGVD